MFHRGGDAHLDPELVRPMCFALLSSTVVAPLYGKLSDIYGRRAMMLASIGIFVAGSAACAAAHDMIMLILGRGLQGIGGGGILPLAQAILADAVAPRERGRYQAYMGSAWVTAGLGGPIVGGKEKPRSV
jgi:MFS family permease